MTRLRTAFFAFIVTLTTMVALPYSVQAEEWSYSASSSRFIDFGELGGFYGSQPQTTEIFDIGFNAGGGANLLGCAGISLEGFMDVFASFEHVFDSFLNNIKQAFFRRLLVEAFSRLPQIGALFDTVNAMGNARFEMFNESCDINSIRQDAQALLERRCIEGGGNALQCNPATAQDGFLSNIVSTVNEQLESFHNRMRNVNNPLRGGMCEYTSTDPFCAAMSFMPQFQLCYSLGMNTSSGNSGRGIGGCTQTRAASAPIGPDQLFNSAFGMALNSTQGQSNFMNQLARDLPPAQLNALTAGFNNQASQPGGAIASLAESTPASNQIASNSALGAGRPFNLALVDFDFDVAQFANESGGGDVDKLKRFLHCSNSNPLSTMESFSQYLSETGVSGGGGLPELSVDQIAATDVLNFDNATQLTQIAMGDAGNALSLIQTAVGCVLNHQLHIGLDSYVALTRLTEGDRAAFTTAAANRVAYLTTEVLLRYLKQNVLRAHAQLASGFTPETMLQNALEATGSEETGSVGGANDFETPEPVLIAIKTIADMFENQIQALRSIRTERDTFAKISGVIFDKIEEQEEAAEAIE